MDIENDIMLKRFYNEYVNICELYAKGSIDNDIAVSELKTLCESIGLYVSGVFEIKRREKGGE